MILQIYYHEDYIIIVDWPCVRHCSGGCEQNGK